MKRLIVFSFVFILAVTVSSAGTKIPVIKETSPFVKLCEAVDNCNLIWSTGGSAHWFTQTDTFHDENDKDAARSGAIGNNQTTYLQTTVTGPGELNFYWKVSSEKYYDYLWFYIDGDLQTGISGDIDWKPSINYTIPAGIHTLKWEYSKDFWGNIGSDCGWVDEVQFKPEPAFILNRNQLAFGAAPGTATGDQTFSISKNAANTLNWSVAVDQNWLSCTPISGTDSGVVTVSVDTTGLSAGTYTGSIIVSSPNAAHSPQQVSVTLKVYRAGGSSVPFGDYATPTNNSTIRSSVPFTGWVLDDVGVESVKLYRLEGNSPVYIGNAVFVEGARPDVEQAYPGYPFNYKAGWGYMMLTNSLPNGGNGTFTIEAIAVDLEGQKASLGTKTVIVDNANAVKPFGAIDTPAQGGTASGSQYRNQGWVLTPLPNTIPTDGSTIYVYIDGVNLGHPDYNVFRSDIASLFPGYNNSDGAQAHFDFDTTAYENGVHTIGWSAADNAGNVDGIGSRYFMIQNSSSGSRVQSAVSTAQSTRRTAKCPELMSTGPVGIVKGFRKDAEPREIYPDHRGIVTVKIKELERLEIHFDEFKKGIAESRKNNSQFTIQNSKLCAGFLVVGNELRRLPIGSTFNIETGTFSWQAGPGFCGDYRLMFVERDAYGNLTKRTVFIHIAPKF